MSVVKISVYGGRVKTAKSSKKKKSELYETYAADFETDESAVEHAAKALGATHVAKTNYGIFALTPRRDGTYDAYLVYYFEGKWHLQRIPTTVSKLPEGSVEISTSPKVKASEGAKAAGGYSTVERDPKEVAQGKALGYVHSPRAVYDLLHEQIAKESQEVFLVIPLNLHGEPLCKPVEVARGQRDQVAVDSADILRPVIATNAAGFIIVHNHPSTHAKPSRADLDLTKHVKEATVKALPQVVFLDHVIIGSSKKSGEYYSVTEGKLYKA